MGKAVMNGRGKIKRDSKGRRTDRVKRREIQQMEKRRREGYTPEEIAKDLKRDVRTVKVHLRVLDKPGLPVPERHLTDKAQARLAIQTLRILARPYVGVERITRRVAQALVRNDGKDAARGCRGFLVIEEPKRAETYPLHWASTQYTWEDDSAAPVDIAPGTTRWLDVCFTIAPPYPQPPKAQPADVYPSRFGPGTATMRSQPDWEQARGAIGASLSEHWTVTADRKARTWTQGKGCWIAAPLALSQPHMAQQFYLPPGAYRIQVRVTCEHGGDDEKTFCLASPKTWDALSLQEPDA